MVRRLKPMATEEVLLELRFLSPTLANSYLAEAILYPLIEGKRQHSIGSCFWSRSIVKVIRTCLLDGKRRRS